MNIAAYIDHTVLKPTTTTADVERLCGEAKEYGFAAVCVPPYYVSAAKRLLAGTEVKVATVVGFPFGYSDTAAKIKEIETAISNGADELDIVHNLAALKSGDWDYLRAEAEACIKAVHAGNAHIKIIIESGLLSDEELLRCCEIYTPLQPDFLKTSTGYAETGATVHAVQLMRAHLPTEILIKAAGGIKTYAFAKELVDAGADRIGCSASVDIVKGMR